MGANVLFFPLKSLIFLRPFLEDTSTDKWPVSAIGDRQWLQPDISVSHALQPRPPEKPRTQCAKTRAKSSRLTDKQESVALSAKLAASDKYAPNVLGSNSERVSQITKWQPSPVPTEDVTMLKGGGGHASPASTLYTPVDVFLCSSCDKMYNTQKDLEIHKSFCYGRVNEDYA